MDEVIKFIRLQGGQGDPLTLWEFMFAIILCVVCLSLVCFIYKLTHKSSEYSQSFVQTLILTGMVTALIMIVIGSNIARAFSLVGALSVIRFRNAVKETRDVGFIFFSMAIAMACGTRFYKIAIIATLIICVVMFLMWKFNFGVQHRQPERLLKARFPGDKNPEELVLKSFFDVFEAFSIVSFESVEEGQEVEVLFSVRPMPGISASQIIDCVSRVNDNLKITYNYSSDNA